MVNLEVKPKGRCSFESLALWVYRGNDRERRERREICLGILRLLRM
jgi:hypothetical protein